MPLTPLNGLYRSFKARHLNRTNTDQYVKTTDDDHVEDSASVLSDATTLAQSKRPSAQQGADSIDYGSTRYCASYERDVHTRIMLSTAFYTTERPTTRHDKTAQ
ncbi:hypothetical protein AbraIFM66950_005376 [Aspergillus brasiliensis]|nr:hypothetical protein AbraIFM66950_005376 [Aspergillus brasiliensis]